MKLTPREPTPEMVEAAAWAQTNAAVVWRAMHDAAPSAEPVADEPGSLTNTMDVRDATFDLPLPVYYDTRPAAAPAERGEYPPLPETRVDYFDNGRIGVIGYDADQMRAYVDADRAQRVPLTSMQFKRIYALWAAKTDATLDDLKAALDAAHGIGAKP